MPSSESEGCGGVADLQWEAEPDGGIAGPCGSNFHDMATTRRRSSLRAGAGSATRPRVAWWEPTTKARWSAGGGRGAAVGSCERWTSSRHEDRRAARELGRRHHPCRHRLPAVRRPCLQALLDALRPAPHDPLSPNTSLRLRPACCCGVQGAQHMHVAMARSQRRTAEL